MTKPIWWNDSKLVKVRYEQDETGWAVDIGDGLYRLASNPIRGALSRKGQKDVAQWGDLVRLKPNNGEESWLEVIEKYIEKGE